MIGPPHYRKSSAARLRDIDIYLRHQAGASIEELADMHDLGDGRVLDILVAMGVVIPRPLDQRRADGLQRSEAVRARVFAGESFADIARSMGVSSQRVHQLFRRK